MMLNKILQNRKGRAPCSKCYALSATGGYISGLLEPYPEYSSLCSLGSTCTESMEVDMTNEDAAYIAGLFDGEGSIYYAKRKEKKKKHKGDGYRYSMSQRISMEITMTDEMVIRWVHEVLGVGTVVKKPRKGLRKDGTKYLMQYKWRCTFRDAYKVCRLIWPWSKTKLEKVEKIIDHYSPEHVFDGKVVSMDEYKMRMSLE